MYQQWKIWRAKKPLKSQRLQEEIEIKIRAGVEKKKTNNRIATETRIFDPSRERVKGFLYFRENAMASLIGEVPASGDNK